MMEARHGALGELISMNEKSPTKGVWNVIADPFVVKQISDQVDFIIIDLEHGFRDFSNFYSCFLAASNSKAQVYVRVQNSRDAWLQTLLDMGVTNFVLPQIRSIDELNDFQKLISFPPEGARGSHPKSRTSLKSGSDEITCCVIIETVESLLILDEIASHPVATEFYLGVYDLSSEAQISGSLLSPEMSEILSRLVDCASKSDKKVLVMNSDNLSMEALSVLGINKIVMGIDINLLLENLKSSI